MAGLLDGYGIDPLGMGLLGAGGALLTPRQQGGGIGAALQAFPQGMMQGQEMQRRLQAQAQAQQYQQQRMGMEQRRFGMDEQKFSLELKEYEARQTAAAREQQFMDDFVAYAAQKDPEIALLARVDRKAAVERAFPKPEWRTWFNEKGQQTQGYAAPGQAPTQVGGAERKMVGVNQGDRYSFVEPLEQTAPLPMFQSPDSKASVSATLRQQDITERARQAEASRPIWSQEQGAFVYRPSAAAPTGTFVQPVGPGGMPLPPKTADLAKIETDIRKELNDLPQVKKFANATPAYKAIVDAAGRNNKQADINLVYGLAKLYDPDSVVREGEYDTIAKSQTIPEWLKGQAAALTGTGGKLTAQTRALILKEAEGRFNSYRTEYDSVTTRYSEIARQRGANPENVVVPIAGDIPKGGSWSIKKVE